MQRVATASDMLRDPVGRWLAGERWLYFCASANLFGFLLWGRVTSDDMRELERALEVELSPNAERHMSLVDVSRVDAVAEGAFDALGEYVRARHDALAGKVERLALVHGSGITGAVASGFFRVVEAPYAVEAFGDARAAARWLGVGPDIATELAAAHRAAVESSSVLARVRAMLDADPAAPISSAARALGMSTRSLQLRLTEEGTSFRDERQRARVRKAERLLLETDAPLTAVAMDVGCSSLAQFSALFRRITGEPPSRWRAARRAREGR